MRTPGPRLRQIPFALVALALLLHSTGAGAAPERQQVEQTLSGVEWIPTKQQLLRLGPDVDQVLRQIALQPQGKSLARNRAITLLRFFPSKATASVLEQVITKNQAALKGPPVLHVKQALVSYAVVRGPDALKLIHPFLTHKVPDLRYSAVEAVRRSRSPKALALLEARKKLEPSPIVKHHLLRQITHLRQPAPAATKHKR
jgi:hypothetical protein